MATQRRFILIWGVIGWGGWMIAIEPNDWRPPLGHALIMQGTKPIIGAGVAFVMWYFLQWQKKQLQAKVQRGNSDA
jgi:hypothetical protein